MYFNCTMALVHCFGTINTINFRTFHHQPKPRFSSPSSPSLLPPLALGNHESTFCIYGLLICLFGTFHVNWFIHVVFCDWSLSLSMFSRFVMLEYLSVFHFFLLPIFHCMDRHFVYPFISRWAFECLYVWAIMNK